MSLRVPAGELLASAVSAQRFIGGRIALPRGGDFSLFDGKAHIQASLPMRTYGNNLIALEPHRFEEAVVDLVEEAASFVDLGLHVDHEFAVVKRLDVVRDFDGGHDRQTLLDGLVSVPRHGKLRTSRYGDANGRTQSLVVQVRSWQGTLYDKAAQSRSLAPPGRMRFEAVLRSSRLQQQWAADHGGRISVVRDVTPWKVANMAKATFQDAGFDRPVLSRTEVVRRVALVPELKHGMERAVLLGLLVGEAAGADLGLDPKTVRRYRGLAKKYGLQLSPDVVTGGVRLDWAAGTEVAA